VSFVTWRIRASGGKRYRRRKRVGLKKRRKFFYELIIDDGIG
jgi:hypothetical protein